MLMNVFLMLMNVFLMLMNVFLMLMNVFLMLMNVFLMLMNVFLMLMNVFFNAYECFFNAYERFLMLMNVFLMVMNGYYMVITLLLHGRQWLLLMLWPCRDPIPIRLRSLRTSPTVNCDQVAVNAIGCMPGVSWLFSLEIISFVCWVLQLATTRPSQIWTYYVYIYIHTHVYIQYIYICCCLLLKNWVISSDLRSGTTGKHPTNCQGWDDALVSSLPWCIPGQMDRLYLKGGTLWPFGQLT